MKVRSKERGHPGKEQRGGGAEKATWGERECVERDAVSQLFNLCTF